MYYLYLLYSATSDIHYVGYSDNPQQRLIEHNTKEKGTFSAKHRPWIIAAMFEAGSKDEAIAAERFIKKHRSPKLIAKLQDPSFVLDGQLAKLIRVAI